MLRRIANRGTTAHGAGVIRWGLTLAALSLCGCTLLIGEFEPSDSFCGDGVVDAPTEQCDGDNLNDETCDTLGHHPGTLRCNEACHFAYDQCGGECGDDELQPNYEDCDGSLFQGNTCSNLVQGASGGELRCDPTDCTIDTGGCWVCGNGRLEGSESCDGTDFGGETCTDHQFTGGTLRCSEECTVSTDGCVNCEDGICEPHRGETPENCFSECGYSYLSVGPFHVCAIRQDGSLWCWGGNDRGQLGNSQGGAGVLERTPVPVNTTRAFRRVCSGERFSCATDLSGEVWCWGDNTMGQLGTNESAESRGEPQQVTALSGKGVHRVACGKDFACAPTQGELWCWGSNELGKLGVNQTATALPLSKVPLQVPFTGLSNVGLITNVALGEQHGCAMNSDGDVFCWGAGGNRLGDGSQADSPTPVAVSLDTDAMRHLAVGGYHACVSDVNDTPPVSCWGVNSDGQFADGTTTSSGIPTPWAATSFTPAWIDGGDRFTCAAAADTGEVYCWGRCQAGQCGADTGGCSGDDHRDLPQQIMTVGGDALLSGTLFVSAGNSAACTTDSMGQAWCWGLNTSGLLGIEDSSFQCTHLAHPVAY